MTTIGWLLLIIAFLILRGVAKGRALETPGDLRDMFVALVSGDVAAVKEVASRTGTGLTLDTVTAASGDSSGAGGTVTGDGTTVYTNTLVAEARRLAAQANYKYRWGGTTTSGFDCSGLVWRVCVNMLGAKRVGSRFTTATFAKASKNWARGVSSPETGDIVVWNRSITDGHMGFVIGPDRMFSALSTKAGITESKISAERGTPMYYRVTG